MHLRIQVNLRNQVTQVIRERVCMYCFNLVTVNHIHEASYFLDFSHGMETFLTYFNSISDTRS